MTAPVSPYLEAPRRRRANMNGDSPDGQRRVVFEYCVSCVFLTWRGVSRVYTLRQSETGFLRGLPYNAVSLLAGWWGVPWGLIYTPLALWRNLNGGRESPGDVNVRPAPGGAESEA
jgi:hypothetical protein